MQKIHTILSALADLTSRTARALSARVRLPLLALGILLGGVGPFQVEVRAHCMETYYRNLNRINQNWENAKTAAEDAYDHCMARPTEAYYDAVASAKQWRDAAYATAIAGLAAREALCFQSFTRKMAAALALPDPGTAEILALWWLLRCHAAAMTEYTTAIVWIDSEYQDNLASAEYQFEAARTNCLDMYDRRITVASNQRHQDAIQAESDYEQCKGRSKYGTQ
ncbi:MAG: hypothetical protein M2R45_02709 [Verrucomicrobia subdivision 3 bacterium]|nr:hypothetical protein [Limisphaerales bacterium]MCS1415050.1 hypothetical protein [Limisphaerales bacterium]